MVIFSKSTIKQYCIHNKSALDAFMDWYNKAKAAGWANFLDMKRSFNSVDAVGNDLYIFNIKGNHYRLVAKVFFRSRTIYIKFLGTHKEYDNLDLAALRKSK